MKVLDEDTFVRLPGEGGMPVTNRDIAEQFGLGIGQARRGWLEAGDVANTRSLFALRKLIRRN